MSIIDDGGPAFPDGTGAILRRNGALDEMHGMTLRDYFAARFLAGFWSNSEALKQIPHGDEAALIAKMAYEQADAMLKERAK